MTSRCAFLSPHTAPSNVKKIREEETRRRVGGPWGAPEREPSKWGGGKTGRRGWRIPVASRPDYLCVGSLPSVCGHGRAAGGVDGRRNPPSHASLAAEAVSSSLRLGPPVYRFILFVSDMMPSSIHGIC
ncbi:hypothetical protein Taro_018558 [Colocasia esculenta]|uniref:Uncharacterized protein n=1 Tax=Colocasia esculenta TaxID=4460 RepID=A0A843UR25_COLES|nr:hypothetical protein [Colocasia esculenta]